MFSIERHYPNGALYARFTEEKHEYFYADGSLKTLEHYLNGRLHGEITLYWPNGKLKRKCCFQNGIRVGLDQMWNENGTLMDEKDYGTVS